MLKLRLAAMINELGTIKEKIQEILFRYRATRLNNGDSPVHYLYRQIQLDALRRNYRNPP